VLLLRSRDASRNREVGRKSADLTTPKTSRFVDDVVDYDTSHVFDGEVKILEDLFVLIHLVGPYICQIVYDRDRDGLKLQRNPLKVMLSKVVMKYMSEKQPRKPNFVRWEEHYALPEEGWEARTSSSSSASSSANSLCSSRYSTGFSTLCPISMHVSEVF